ncbi:MAG: DNA primase family protein [Pseudomonas sp.]
MAHTRLIDINYDAEAVCPAWDTFLREVFLGDEGLIRFVQRAAGYSLTGLTREHVLFILFGLGANGKTTFVGALSELLGPYATTAPPDLLLARRGEHHPTELATLHGARLVTASETGDGRRLAESLVKQLTGGDHISARRMREDYWTFSPTHKLWLATNHKPEIRGTDHAIWRRIRLIPFGATFHPPESGQAPAQDPELPDRLRADLPGILAWATRGSVDWQREGLGIADAVRDATAAYRAEMDVLVQWIDDCCVVDRRAEAGATELYRSYVGWCETTGERAESQRSFGARLSERGYAKQPGRKARGYRGIGLIRDACDVDSGMSATARASWEYTEKPVTSVTPVTCVDSDRWCNGIDSKLVANGRDQITWACTGTSIPPERALAGLGDEDLIECARNPSLARQRVRLLAEQK